MGTACELIIWSWRSVIGTCSTSTAVILPLATVIWTCTGPKRVSAASPAYVLAALEVPDPDVSGDVDELPDEELSSVPPVPPADPDAGSVVVLGALRDVMVVGRSCAVATTDERDVW